jgi:hypothetical protein
MLRSTKPPKCKQCRRRLEQLRPGQMVHEECVEAYVLRLRAKMLEAAQKKERAETRAKREEMKSQRRLIAEAQEAFNEFIRERDRDAGCFVCDASFQHTEGSLGGVMDAGHVRSRGAASHLRFHEDNCHGECKNCNASFGAKPHEIEEGAIRRIGQERFDALKTNNRPHKWTREELRGIRDTYRAKAKELKAHRSADMGVSE